MKRAITLIVTLTTIFCLAIALTGCGESSSSSSTSSSKITDAQDLVLQDSGYTVDNGYVHYAVNIYNPNTKYANQSPTLTVKGKNKSGATIFSEEYAIGYLMPDSATYWAGQAGNGTEPAEVEFSLTWTDSNWLEESAFDKNIYSANEVEVVKGSSGYDVVGELVLEYEPAHNSKMAGSFKKPEIMAVFLDADGNILSGYATAASSELSVGTPVAFDVPCNGTVPNYSSIAVAAQPWK